MYFLCDFTSEVDTGIERGEARPEKISSKMSVRKKTFIQLKT